ncbi:MAG: iron-sulfur cluster assembly scaffold protein [Pyrinomonadaceae bacterium]
MTTVVAKFRLVFAIGLSEAVFRMSIYTGRTREHFLRPRNVGEVEGAEAVGDTGSLTCGAIVRLTFKVDAREQKITDAKFKAIGCGYLIAAASAVTEIVKGLQVGEAARLPADEINAQLDEVPPHKAHCIALCQDALHDAAVHYRLTTLEEWTGEEALVCTCFCVSEKIIEREIHTRSLRTITEVTRACNAGGGCRSCHPLIEDILEDYWRTSLVNGE